jgi:uncharacterized protein YbaP (TraB family)
LVFAGPDGASDDLPHRDRRPDERACRDLQMGQSAPVSAPLPRPIVVATCAVIALAGARVGADPAPARAPPAPAELADVLVTGEQPGPGMWRVSNGAHELWILGTLDPLPKKMHWRSRQVDATIARSREVLAPPSVAVDVGFFKGLMALPTLLHARKNPGGKTLKDVLPEDVYARWRVLKDEYLGEDDDVERLRPSVVAHELYQHALDHSGLTSGESVWTEVEKTARKNRVPVTTGTVTLALDDPKGTIKKLEQIPHDPDVACLAATIERLETDLQGMRQRASLWALGDVEGLRGASFTDQRAACLEAVTSVPALRSRILELRDQLLEHWLSAAERALANNDSTFAVLPIAELLKPDGWTARLRARGYAVDEP